MQCHLLVSRWPNLTRPFYLKTNTCNNTNIPTKYTFFTLKRWGQTATMSPISLWPPHRIIVNVKLYGLNLCNSNIFPECIRSPPACHSDLRVRLPSQGRCSSSSNTETVALKRSRLVTTKIEWLFEGCITFITQHRPPIGICEQNSWEWATGLNKLSQKSCWVDE